jgi:uncharacterized protein (TIGR03435 family)
VTDSTGLTAKYEFKLRFSNDVSSEPGMGINMGPGPAGMAPPPPPPPPGSGMGGGVPMAMSPEDGAMTVFAAIQQLGLKLEQKKGPVDVVVIDHIEKVPTEN